MLKKRNAGLRIASLIRIFESTQLYFNENLPMRLPNLAAD